MLKSVNTLQADLGDLHVRWIYSMKGKSEIKESKLYSVSSEGIHLCFLKCSEASATSNSLTVIMSVFRALRFFNHPVKDGV